MKLDYQKEIIPVLYGGKAIKVLEEIRIKPNYFGFPLHWHERMELLLVLEGSLKVKVGDQEIEAKKDSLVIIPPEKPHMGTSGEKGVRYRTIMFDISTFYNSSNVSRQFLEPIVNQTVDFDTITYNKEIISLAHSLLEEHLSEDSISTIIAMGKIYELLGLIYRHCLCEKQSAVPDDRLKNVLDYIAKHYCEGITSSGLSEYFGYDESYFCRRFKSVTGLTPISYIQILRLEEAKNKIKNTELKISEISSLCGFQDPNYFSRCFKRHFGISPAAYMEKERKS